MISGAGFLGGATHGSNFVVLSPQERSALVGISPQMLRFPYHTRYELIEFAVFTLAPAFRGWYRCMQHAWVWVGVGF